MIIDALEKSIDGMKEIKNLEQSFNDIRKQEKNDRIFQAAVNENAVIIMALSQEMQQFGFNISIEQLNKLTEILKICDDALSKGVVQESTAHYIQEETAKIRKKILQEWNMYYHHVADHKINMLQTIKGIVPEKEKIDYAANKIKCGEAWDFKQENIDKMKKGMSEAEEIIENLGLIDEVTEFFKKVMVGKANVSDLSPIVLNWIKDKNISSKLGISFI